MIKAQWAYMGNPLVPRTESRGLPDSCVFHAAQSPQEKTTPNTFADVWTVARTARGRNIGGPDMNEHEFTLVLSVAEVTDDQCNALYEAGCDDGTISTSQRVTRIDFCREAPHLEEAIRSAIASVNAVGLAVARVEMEADNLVPQGA